MWKIDLMATNVSLRARLFCRVLGLMRVYFANLSVEQTRKLTKNSVLPLPRNTKITQIDEIAAQWIDTPKPVGVLDSKVLLYLHGGCYVQKTPGVHHSLVARLAVACGCRTLYVDYRLAPEHPFPAALDDTIAAYRWLLHQNIPAANIMFAGDSAGGGLAVAALVRLRDDHIPLPAGAVLMSPWCDLTMNSPAAIADDDPIYARKSFLHFARLYAADTALNHPLVSPNYASLEGLPPMLIQAGARELLRDDATTLAKLSRDAGNSVHLSVYPGLWHVWQVYPPLLVPESKTALQEIATFLHNL
jgi:epsilon-lactone hydrolase